MKSRQIHYEHGERAGRFLCYQLKQSAAAGIIAAIEDSEGNIITEKQGINNQFKSFYEALYTSEVNDTDRIEEFFSNIELPSFNDSDKSTLEGNITGS